MAKSPLHDNPRSGGGDKPKEKAEEKPKGDGDEKAATEKKAAEKPKAEAGEEKVAEGAADKAAEDTASPKDKFMDGLKMVQKRHEAERRDTHGNFRESLRQMASRHNKEIADHFDLHFGEGGTAKAEEKPAAEAPAEEA